jgi:Na+/proline symporter
MLLTPIDWIIIAAFFALSLAIGVAVARRSGSSTAEFFLSGREMPWWLLGISLVATTFSADTPNLVTDLVRTSGVAGNWAWWAFLLTGMLTVFVYAKLWRRSRVLTDLEFYELRYSGPEASFLRGFRAIYLGLFFNVMIMATVCLAAIKIGGVLLGISPVQTLLMASFITVIYSSIGGFRGVLFTDFFQFIIAMIGAFGAAFVALDMPQVGGLGNLLAHEAVAPRLNIIPDFSAMSFKELLPVFILPLAIQWWSVWYPGAEPGGGGYVAQRMLSAKNERHAIGATLIFNALHYALRPWPWIIVALASIIVFPDLASIQQQFPHIDPSIVRNDLAYPAMLTFLPKGLLGLVVASLIAAFMSTIATHLNWGSSYIVNDFWARFVDRKASEKTLVNVGRASTAVLMVLAAILALYLENALQAFNILLQIGAGTGLLFLLRWFWYRINAWSEIAAMGVSFLVAVYFELIHTRVLGMEKVASEYQLIIGVAITTVAWLLATLLTRPSDAATLRRFYRMIRPAGNGWKAVIDQARADGDPLPEGPAKGELSLELLCMAVGALAIYSALFATGLWIYSNFLPAAVLTLVAGAASYFLFRLWGRLQTMEDHEIPEA